MTQTSKCQHWDCGWCYAPAGTPNNSENGGCYNPESCEELAESVPIEDIDVSSISVDDLPEESYLQYDLFDK